MMGTFKIPEDEAIESSIITRSLETAQKRIEGFNFDARKQTLAYDDVLNTQRLSIYRQRRAAMLGSNEDMESIILEMIGGDEVAKAAYDAKRSELGPELLSQLSRRLLLQIIDTFWLEHLDTMEYLRSSVSLRAYGQRDPLVEYRREGSARFLSFQANVANTFRETLPKLQPADDSHIRAEEEKVRKQLVAVSEGGDDSAEAPKPIVNTNEFNRNDTVTIRKGEEVQTLKYKKAEQLLAEGWTIVAE
jgi:preprotein translocase subunit SecA